MAVEALVGVQAAYLVHHLPTMAPVGPTSQGLIHSQLQRGTAAVEVEVDG